MIHYSPYKFTMEKPDPNLPFLDTEVFVKNGKLHHKFYRKPTASNTYLNFRHSIVPRNFTKSTLDGEIYRCNNTCSDSSELKTALKNIQDTFIQNDYPPKLVQSRISEIQKNDFKKQPRNTEMTIAAQNLLFVCTLTIPANDAIKSYAHFVKLFEALHPITNFMPFLSP